MKGELSLNDIFDYIYWRGDLSFDLMPLNEVDALIFSEFSYIDFTFLAEEALNEGRLTIEKAASILAETDREIFMPSGYLHHEEAYELLKLAGETKRFKDILISNDTKYLSLENVAQFGATTFQREGRPFFIAFEGTGLRNVGWKEDLQMTYLPEIPSQKRAVNFLNQHFDKYKTPISIGGHSKGGNLAIYAAMFLEEKQPLIDKIYSFDSPGMVKELLENEGYQKIKNKIESFIPQDSIVGLLLHKLEKPKIISSHASELLQHDVYTWKIKRNSFVSDELTNSARKIQQLINQLLDNFTLEERENFTEALFSLLGDGEDDYIIGDKQYILERIPVIVREFRELNQEGRQILIRVFRLFYRKRIELKIENRLDNK